MEEEELELRKDECWQSRLRLLLEFRLLRLKWKQVRYLEMLRLRVLELRSRRSTDRAKERKEANGVREGEVSWRVRAVRPSTKLDERGKERWEWDSPHQPPSSHRPLLVQQLASPRQVRREGNDEV